MKRRKRRMKRRKTKRKVKMMKRRRMRKRMRMNGQKTHLQKQQQWRKARTSRMQNKLSSRTKMMPLLNRMRRT